MLILFLVLLIVPLVLRSIVDVKQFGDSIPMNLMQPLDTNNNDTSTGYTGKNLPAGKVAMSGSAGGASSSA